MLHASNTNCGQQPIFRLFRRYGIGLRGTSSRERDGLALFIQQRAVTLPVKIGARVGLAPWRDVRVAGDFGNRIAALQCTREARKHFVLSVFKRNVIRSLDFDAEREIIALLPATPE